MEMEWTSIDNEIFTIKELFENFTIWTFSQEKKKANFIFGHGSFMFWSTSVQALLYFTSFSGSDK